jgi:hypothetical protein
MNTWLSMFGGIEQSNPKENECSSSGAGVCLQTNRMRRLVARTEQMRITSAGKSRFYFFELQRMQRMWQHTSLET